MELGELISEYRKQAGLTIDMLAEKSNVPKGTLNKIINGVTKDPQLETVKAIAYALGCTLDDFDTEPTPRKLSPDEYKHIKKYRMLDERGKKAIDTLLDFELSQVSAAPEPATVEMIVYTYPAAAGVPLYADDDYEQMEFPESSVPKGANFGIRISGDSMEPTIQDGAIVWVRKCPELQNGQIGVFMMDDTSVCKRYYKKGKTVELHSDNPAYEPIIIKDYERFGIIGKVLEYR